MKTKDKSISALLSVFPSHEAFRKFYEDSSHSKAVESFVAYAAKNNIIKTGDVNSLEAFIRQQSNLLLTIARRRIILALRHCSKRKRTCSR